MGDSVSELEKIFTDPREPGSYSGAEKIQKALKKKKLVYKKDVVQGWLKTKDSYTKHRPARKNFKRNQVVAAYIDEQWQGDLAEVWDIASQNKGIRYLLVLIDVVSKYLWVEPLKSKTGPVVLAGFKKIFEGTERRPKKLQTDDGKEFWYGGLQNFLKEKDITFFTLKSDKKASLAERVIRTLKEKMFRYMTEKHTKKYIDVLSDLVFSYNNTYHTSIGMTPAEVNIENEGKILRKLYGAAWGVSKKVIRKEKPKYKIGEFVRISKLKGPFGKGYRGNWTEEVFIVSKVIKSFPYTRYEVKDWGDEVLKGMFYEKELQSVGIDTGGYWKVEKVIKSKKIGKKTKYLVKWEGYPESLNSWVDESDIKRIRASGSGS
jgi:transposase InsO family protein